MFWRNVLLRNLESLVLLASTHDSVGDHLSCKLTGEISLQKPAFYPWIEVDWEGRSCQICVSWRTLIFRFESEHCPLPELDLLTDNFDFTDLSLKFPSPPIIGTSDLSLNHPPPHPPTIGTSHAVYYNLTVLFVTVITERNWAIR